MEAQLHIVNDETHAITELILSDAITQPTPEHPVLRREWQGFSYEEKVAVVSNEAQGGLGTTIHTRAGSGRGQAATFDKLVGPRVADERKKLAKKLREELEFEGAITIELTASEVAGIEDRIQLHSDGLPEDKFLWQAPTWFRKTTLVTDKSFSNDRAVHV